MNPTSGWLEIRPISFGAIGACFKLPVNHFETPIPATPEDGGFTSSDAAWNKRNGFSWAMGNTGD